MKTIHGLTILVLMFGSVACQSDNDVKADGTAHPRNGDETVVDTDDTSASYGDSDTGRTDGDTGTDADGGTDKDDITPTDTGTVSSTDSDISVGPLLRPFDANRDDLVALQNWNARYGKTPEIVAVSTGRELHVLAQDYDDETPWRAVLLHIKYNGTGYQVTNAMTDIPMLDRIMGLAVDDEGNRYYATAVAEGDRVDPDFPPVNTWRSDIVRVIRLSANGDVAFNIDLDLARNAADADAEPIINPMTASTARLAVGGDEVALVHGNNTDPDWEIEGRRHQKALSTRLDATTGAITRVSSAWVSHSFDQRLMYDGSGIIEYHLGDAYPRYVVFGKNHRNEAALYIKGPTGANETHTRLGNVARIENDDAFGYLALFATENNDLTDDTINGPRNLAIVRLHNEHSHVDDALPHTLEVTSAEQTRVNRLRWITEYSDDSGRHAERPKLLNLGNDRFLVLWEEWEQGNTITFNGVLGMTIDAHGRVLESARILTTEYHLHRGDDAFVLSEQGGWITGDERNRTLILHRVDAALNYEAFTLP